MVAVSLLAACPTLLTCLKLPHEAQQAPVTFFSLCASLFFFWASYLHRHNKLLLCLRHLSVSSPLLAPWEQKDVSSQEHRTSTALVAKLHSHFLRNNFLHLFLFLPTVLFLSMLSAEGFCVRKLCLGRKVPLLQLLYLGELLAQAC